MSSVWDTGRANMSRDVPRYKIGDAFVSLPQAEVLELLGSATENIEKEVETIEEELSNVRDEMQECKVALYARFGRSINLET